MKRTNLRRLFMMRFWSNISKQSCTYNFALQENLFHSLGRICFSFFEIGFKTANIKLNTCFHI